jgi:hypothetical protein
MLNSRSPSVQTGDQPGVPRERLKAPDCDLWEVSVWIVTLRESKGDAPDGDGVRPPAAEVHLDFARHSVVAGFLAEPSPVDARQHVEVEGGRTFGGALVFYSQLIAGLGLTTEDFGLRDQERVGKSDAICAQPPQSWSRRGAANACRRIPRSAVDG